jgi:hypothetical protein
MPTTVRKHITVAELRPGDIIDETPPAIVESLARKTTWGLVQIAGEPKPRRLRLDTNLTVLRDELTDDEQASRRLTHTVEILKADLADWLRHDPARMLRDIVDHDPGYGQVLTWSNLPDVLKAQAMFRHARTLWHHLGEPADLATVSEDALLEAFTSWWYTHVHQPSDHGPRHDPISRSTSAISNIIDDCDDWSIQQIRARISWAGARDELQRRVGQALAAREQ